MPPTMRGPVDPTWMWRAIQQGADLPMGELADGLRGLAWSLENGMKHHVIAGSDECAAGSDAAEAEFLAYSWTSGASSTMSGASGTEGGRRAESPCRSPRSGRQPTGRTGATSYASRKWRICSPVGQPVRSPHSAMRPTCRSPARPPQGPAASPSGLEQTPGVWHGT